MIRETHHRQIEFLKAAHATMAAASLAAILALLSLGRTTVAESPELVRALVLMAVALPLATVQYYKMVWYRPVYYMRLWPAVFAIAPMIPFVFGILSILQYMSTSSWIAFAVAMLIGALSMMADPRSTGTDRGDPILDARPAEPPSAP